MTKRAIIDYNNYSFLKSAIKYTALGGIVAPVVASGIHMLGADLLELSAIGYVQFPSLEQLKELNLISKETSSETIASIVNATNKENFFTSIQQPQTLDAAYAMFQQPNGAIRSYRATDIAALSLAGAGGVIAATSGLLATATAVKIAIFIPVNFAIRGLQNIISLSSNKEANENCEAALDKLQKHKDDNICFADGEVFIADKKASQEISKKTEQATTITEKDDVITKMYVEDKKVSLIDRVSINEITKEPSIIANKVMKEPQKGFEKVSGQQFDYESICDFGEFNNKKRQEEEHSLFDIAVDKLNAEDDIETFNKIFDELETDDYEIVEKKTV